jgi:sec-independent protein translocase protein TatA
MGTGLFSPTHLVILLLVALLLFGAKRLPEIGRSLGVGMREFKDSVTGVQEATKIDVRSELPPPAPTAPVATPAAAPVEVAPPAPAEPAAANSEREVVS